MQCNLHVSTFYPQLLPVQQHEHIPRVDQCSQEQSRGSFSHCGRSQCIDEQWSLFPCTLALRSLCPGTDAYGNAASLKRLIFEAQTLICSEVKNKAGKREDSSHVSFAAPERDARIVQQRNRLTGLRFKGEEECSHASYDLVLAVLEKKIV